MSAFDAVEADFFCDLAQDTHGLWEIFEFVRCHYPQLADDAVFNRGRDYDLTNRWSQPLAVLMISFQMTSTLNSAAKVAVASGGSAPSR